MSASPSPLAEQAIAVLRENDRGAYTVPTKGLYPFQWNWDSCFTALGLAPFRHGSRLDRDRDPVRAPVGRRHGAAHGVPRAGADLFPRPRCLGHRPRGRRPRASPSCRSPASPCTSSSAAAATWPAPARCCTGSSAGIAWFYRTRDPKAEGLVAVIHPWESRDNTIDWDEGFERVPTEGVAPYERNDLKHADPATRPTREQYDRYLWLVQHFRSLEWDFAGHARFLALPDRRPGLQRHPDPLLPRDGRPRRGAGRAGGGRSSTATGPNAASPRWRSSGASSTASTCPTTASAAGWSTAPRSAA